MAHVDTIVRWIIACEHQFYHRKKRLYCSSETDELLD